MFAWEQRKLGESCKSFTDGDWIESKDQSESGVRLLQTGNVGITNFIEKDNKKWITEETFNRLHCSEVCPGDILISRLPEPAGRACIVPDIGYKMITAVDCTIVKNDENFSNEFLVQFLSTPKYFNTVNDFLAGGTRQRISRSSLSKFDVLIPEINEQTKIGAFFSKLDNLITLHQRKFLVSINHKLKGEVFMLNTTKNTDLFCEYYAKWIRVYKEGAIRKVTMDKYLMTYEWLKRLIPSLMICEMNRIAYQQLINDYAELHERQTTMDFHHQLKGAILDAVDEGLIEKDPTRKAIIKGKTPRIKKIKYLNQFELHTLLTHLNLGEKINWDWFILLVAKTGMRFSEALALTPKDFDFAHQSLSINKTWNYKEDGGFLPKINLR